MQNYTGSCLCGNIRYRVSEKPVFPHFCSCRMCQRWSGGPVMAWVDFPVAALVLKNDQQPLVWHRTCETTQRSFCPTCGSGICAQDDGSEMISIAVGTLDNPDIIVPESQSFPESAPIWLRVTAVAAESTHQ